MPSLAEVTAVLDELTQVFALLQSARSEVPTGVVSQDNAEARRTRLRNLSVS